MTQQVLKSHLKVERIINYKESISEETGEILPFYFCKWLGLPYADCTWESVEDLKNFQHLIDEYLDRTNSRRLPNFMCPVLRRRPFAREITKQPSFIGSAKLLLRDYQLLGLNFLHTAWCHSSNVILADEMGLGKTIQCVSFLGYLQYQYNLNGPFLVIVPLSTIVGWQREFKAWVPQLNCVTYVGDRQSREIIREHEFYTENGKLKFNALLTTYELVVKDVNLLCRIQWAAMIVDEAHRLKNHLSQLHTFLSDFHTNFIILVTGTPLQNSLMELWALLRFIMPKKFGSWEDFQGKYGSELNKTSQISELHNDLRPYLLRRVKKDVEKSLPNKVERILRVELSSLQRELYRLILCRNYAALSSKGQKKSFSNIIVELKKCCNHPFLVQEHETTNEADRLKEIVKNSGKLVLLDKLLLRLKETGHRVLIFSQMVRMLDILADYLTLRGFTFQRLDGCIRNEQRERALDHFNRPNSDDFCFLLSTKAGGLGINLATADTVIIFDSDWNPQNDLQAEARAHRIGQKNVVNIYRLLSKESVEEEIFERAKKKLILDHVVIQRMDASGRTILSNKRKDKIPFDKDEMNSILKFGAEKLFSEEEDKKATKNLEELDIDEILQRAETTQDCIEKTAGEHFLSQFNVADFSTRELEKNWDEIIPESVIQKTQADHYDSEFMAVYCLGPRKVKSVERLAGRSDDAAEGRILKRKTLEKKSQTLVNSGSDFTESEIKRFIRASRKFGNVSVRLDDISEEAGLLHKHPLSLQQLSEGLRTGTLKAIKKFNQYDEVGKNKNFSDDKSFSKKQKNFASFYMGSALVNASEQRQREEDMDILASCISSTHSINFRLPASLKATEDDSFLLLGTYIYGLGNWEAIKKDSLFHLNKILPGDGGMPQATHLFNRCVMLFKYLRQKKQANSLLQARKKIPKLRKTSPCKDVDTCALEQAAPTNELSKDSLHYCKSRLRSHKATLRSLSKLKQNVIKYNLTREKANEKFKQYILELGDHIESVLAKESPLESDLHRRVLWDFIATKFISFSSVSEEKLIKVYTKAKLKRTNEEEKLKLN
ncbi:chromodomain-helicase-DNA-binding protein 1-like isoform X2 [Zophobas morio]|uniref:chromodomain-helicase-DNA-binding protein 1-like isoform X2 n=1 Tax=Zophobas morio TaxID=2755281 RepID=UPI003083C72A